MSVFNYYFYSIKMGAILVQNGCSILKFDDYSMVRAIQQPFSCLNLVAYS